jgi:hypothetical protein
MNPLAKLIHSSFGKIIISVLLGLGLASLFRKVCNERNCMVFRPPDMNEIKSNIYKYDKKCYKFNEKAVKCDSTKKKVSFA